MGAHPGAAWDAVRGGRGGCRDLHVQRLFDRSILRLDVGPPQEAVGSTALHHYLDPIVRPGPADRPYGDRRDDAGRIRDPILDSRTASNLSSPAPARR